MLTLAARMSRAKPSAIMAVAEKAKQLKAEGRDIVNFSIGVPNFLPGEHVYAAVREDIMSRQSIVSTMVSGVRTFKDDDPD